MEKVKLGDICDFYSGNAWKSKYFSNIGVPIIRINNLNQNQNDFVYWNKEYDKRYLIKENDILLSLSGTIKIHKWEGPEGLLNQRIVKIQSKEGINKDWVFYKIQNSIDQIINKAKDAIIRNVSINDIKAVELLLPDTDTQNKIVSILDKIKTVLNKRQETIAKYDELLRALFLETFSNPMERPSRWQLGTIQNSLINLSSGTSYSGEENKLLEDDELGVLKVSAVTKGFFNANEFKAVKKDIIKRQIIRPQKGDLLFSRANTLELVGATCIVDADYDNLFLPDKIWKVETDESVVKKTYLHYVLQNKDVRKTFLSIATGSSGSMLNISMDKFRNIVIPYPPIELQEQFEKIYLKYTRIKEILKKSHQHISELFDSVSQLAFIGKLDFNTAVDLEMLLENDYTFFKQNSNQETIKLLLKRLDKDELNDNKFYDQRLYDKAKEFVFELLKEDKIKQVFDNDSKRLKLTI
ncbi:restriction endonuclease subunit S [Elizabethkingia anophelis]|uniref:restriction endonuclease subunit S n=1 Tax=Elizabethkingia anophelis TaxID=1117645 RepID=UPI003892607B